MLFGFDEGGGGSKSSFHHVPSYLNHFETSIWIFLNVILVHFSLSPENA